MEPEISIVVPIYKVEEYLDKCVNSLINQSYTNIEIILVDDGSPDSCPEMCDNYAQQDSRIKVIHKENGGLSDARNTGMRVTKGEYILFVDSDDYIDLDTCEHFIEIINNQKPDIIVGNAKRMEGSKVLQMSHKLNTKSKAITGGDYLKQELKTKTMYMAAWLNLYSRAFLLANKLEFKVGILHEDEQFTPRAFLKAEGVIGTDISFYNYIIREGSITRKLDLSKNGICVIQTCYELVEIYETLKDKELRRLLDDDLVTNYLYGFQMGRLFQNDYIKLIDKGFLLKRATSLRNCCKVLLFVINRRLYYFTNAFFKTTITYKNLVTAIAEKIFKK